MERRINGINVFDRDKILVKREISLIRFRDGGAPMFAEDIINHHIDIIGKRDRRPLFKYILRDFVVS